MCGTCAGYSDLVTMDVITSELVRNILLVLVAIFVCTLLLIANLFTSIIVVTNVFITLVNVGGFMHFWSLTIDTSSAVLLTVAMGLAVDYAAHVGITYFVVPSSKMSLLAYSLLLAQQVTPSW